MTNNNTSSSKRVSVWWRRSDGSDGNTAAPPWWRLLHVRSSHWTAKEPRGSHLIESWTWLTPWVIVPAITHHHVMSPAAAAAPQPCSFSSFSLLVVTLQQEGGGVTREKEKEWKQPRLEQSLSPSQPNSLHAVRQASENYNVMFTNKYWGLFAFSLESVSQSLSKCREMMGRELRSEHAFRRVPNS